MFEKLYKSAKKFDSDFVFCNSMIEEDLTGKSTPKSMKTKIKKITGYTLSEDKCFNISDMQKGQLRIFACVNGFVFKKEFILSNDLKFPKGNLAEDSIILNLMQYSQLTTGYLTKIWKNILIKHKLRFQKKCIKNF